MFEYECYSEAYSYLVGKYGTANNSDIINESKITGLDDRLILTLMRQYNYGVLVKRELHDLLLELNIITRDKTL